MQIKPSEVLLCPFCGRRSFQMPNTCFRQCGNENHDLSEKSWFLELCHRQKKMMTSRDVYFRRRKNAVRTAAKALNKKIKAKSEVESERLKQRVLYFMAHITLLDEIWFYLNPDKFYSNGFGSNAELVSAARAIRDGKFEDYYIHLK